MRDHCRHPHARLLEERSGVSLAPTGMTPELFARGRKRLPLNRWDEAPLERYGQPGPIEEPLNSRDRGRAEKASELASRHPLANVGRVRRTVEEVGVDIERDARPRVPEDPADLGDVQQKVDDKMAREGVPQVMHA